MDFTNLYHTFNIPCAVVLPSMARNADSAPADQRTARANYPSGWLALTKNESVPYIIDALLDLLPNRESTRPSSPNSPA